MNVSHDHMLQVLCAAHLQAVAGKERVQRRGHLAQVSHDRTGDDVVQKELHVLQDR